MSLRPSALSTDSEAAAEMLCISFFFGCWTAIQIACSHWETE